MKKNKNKPAKPVLAALALLISVILLFTLMSCDFSPESAKDNERGVSVNDVSV